VLEGDLAVGHAPSRFDEEGRFVDPELRAQLGEVVDGLVAEVRGATGVLAETA
jgi:hypothetical protein